MRAKLVAEILLTGILVLSLAAIASADPGSQTWYLSRDLVSTDRYTMYKEDTGKTTGTVTIDDADSINWTSDEQASQDVTFPAGLWSCTILLDSAPSGDGGAGSNSFQGRLGTYFPDTGYNWVKFWNWFGDGTTTQFTHSWDPDSFTVQMRHHLAFRITNMHEDEVESITVKVGSNFSYLTSPASDPGYPIPELSTIALVGVGLAALTAYSLFRRRRDHAIGGQQR